MYIPVTFNMPNCQYAFPILSLALFSFNYGFNLLFRKINKIQTTKYKYRQLNSKEQTHVYEHGIFIRFHLLYHLQLYM